MKPLDGLRRLPIEIEPATILRDRVRARVMAGLSAPAPALPEGLGIRRPVMQPASVGFGARFSLVAAFSGLVGATVAVAAPKLASSWDEAMRNHRSAAVIGATSARDWAPLQPPLISSRVQEQLSASWGMAPPRLSLEASRVKVIKAPGQEQTETLASERALLDRAREQLVVGQPARALEMVESHRARFASGSLAEEREALAIIALIKQGARDQAAERAAQFKTTYPNSFLRKTIEAAMAE